MNTRFVFLVSICLLALLLVSSSVIAQNQRVGTTAAPWLLIPTGARDLAMGGSSIATTSGVEAVHWNPAGVGKINGSAEAMFSSMTYIADMSMVYGAVAGDFGDFGTLAFSVTSLAIGNIPITSQTDPEGLAGRSFSPTFVSVGVTYARDITESIAFGVTAKIVNETIDRVAASAVAFDFGIQYINLVGVQGLDLGLAIKNVGTEMKYDGSGLYLQAQATTGERGPQLYKADAASAELPALIVIGLTYEQVFSDNVLFEVGGAYSNDNLYYDEFKLGAEVGYQMESSLSLFARGGYAALAQQNDNNIFGPTFGLGLGYHFSGIDVIVDYAYRSVDFFDANQVISVKLGF